jgi:hypothetical protein
MTGPTPRGTRAHGREPEQSIPRSRPATVSVPALPTLPIRLQGSLCVDLRTPGSAAIVEGRCATD